MAYFQTATVPEKTMCSFEPKIISQTICSIELCWNNYVNCDVFKIEIIHKDCLPQRVYWGTKPQCSIENLSENTCYKYQITALKFNGTDYVPQMASDICRASTKPNIPSTESLFRAVRKSQEYILKRYLKAKPSLINVPEPNGLTPLANAVVFRSKDCVRILLESGANVNLGCLVTNRTPLQMAMFHGLVPIAKLLMDFKADRQLKDCVGMTFIHHAVDGGNLDAIKWALHNCENAEVKDDKGLTALLRAVIMQSKVDIVMFLLQICDANATDNDNRTALDLAKLTNQSEIVDVIEKHNKLIVL